ncbi:MAG: sugar transferase [Pseudomonadota bacterium]
MVSLILKGVAAPRFIYADGRFWVYRSGLKRAFDLICLVPLFLCFMIALSVVVTLTPFLNPGPIFYVQDRVGRFGHRFKLYKFRSIQADGTISRAARFMRKTRVDELPQILNVLKGDMSLIGPRPERPELDRLYRTAIPNYDQRLMVRPGLSGLAQLYLGYTDDVAGARQKLRLDLTYIRHHSLTLDMQIFFNTMKVVFAHLLHIRIKTALG